MRLLDVGAKMKQQFSPSATALLYDRHAAQMYRTALAVLGNTQDAEDAVQDVFISYMRTLPQFTDENHEKAWFLRSVVNRSRDLLRRRSIRSHFSLEEATDLPADTKEDVSALFEALSQLPEKYRTVLVLHALEGFSVEETANILNVGVSAVKMRLARAREKMKILLKEEI